MADFVKMSGVELRSCSTDASGSLTILGCGCALYVPGLSLGAENKNVTGLHSWVEVRGASVRACPWEGKSLCFYTEGMSRSYRNNILDSG